MAIDHQDVISPGLLLEQSQIQFTEFIKSGGEAAIWKVKDLGLGKRILAAKVVVIPYDERSNRQNVARVKRLRDQEATNWAKLTHSSHIVQFLTTIEELQAVGGRQYLFIGFTMPFADLGDLATRLRSPKRLNLSGAKDTVHFLWSIASAVKFAHDVNVAHCDIKADNVLLFQDGASIDPRVMDFGMSLSADFDSSLGGTPEYMPPERFISGRTFTVEELKSADVYSLGILFYEVIVGSRPFVAEIETESGRYENYQKLHAQEPPNLVLVERQSTAEVAELVGAMLSKKAADRPPAFRVVRQLQNLEEFSIVSQSNIQETIGVVRKNSYRWNPAVHSLLGNSLHYYFLGGPAATGDREWLESNLQQNKINGYSFYRVLGGVNYILRAWLKHTYEHQMDRILKQFKMQYGATYTHFHCNQPDQIEMFKPCAKQLAVSGGPEALKGIIACADDDDAGNELRKLMKMGFVSSPLHVPKTPKIRFFITIKASDRIGEWQKGALAQHFTKELEPRVKQLSVYNGEGDYCLVLKFRVELFGQIEEITDALLACCSKARTEGIIASFSTFVEVDKKSVAESDDGSIVREATVVHLNDRDR